MEMTKPAISLSSYVSYVCIVYIGNVHNWLILHGPASFPGQGNAQGILAC